MNSYKELFKIATSCTSIKNIYVRFNSRPLFYQNWPNAAIFHLQHLSSGFRGEIELENRFENNKQNLISIIRVVNFIVRKMLLQNVNSFRVVCPPKSNRVSIYEEGLLKVVSFNSTSSKTLERYL